MTLFDYVTRRLIVAGIVWNVSIWAEILGGSL